MYPTSHISGRIRFAFSSRHEKEQFIDYVNAIEGVERVEYKEHTLTALVFYSLDTPAAFVIEQMAAKKEQPRLSKDDLYFYTIPLIKHPAIKAAWSILLLGFPKGILMFGLCSVGLHRYLDAKF